MKINFSLRRLIFVKNYIHMETALTVGIHINNYFVENKFWVFLVHDTILQQLIPLLKNRDSTEKRKIISTDEESYNELLNNHDSAC